LQTQRLGQKVERIIEMGTNTRDQVIEQIFADARGKDKIALYEMVEIADDRLHDDPEFAEIFGQYDRPSRITPAELYAYARILCMIYEGQLTIVTIPFGEEPFQDHCIDENNLALSRLPDGITAKFTGGLSDDDGIVRWSVPLSLNMFVDGKEYKSTLTPDGYPPYAPLEVGYTSFVTSFNHLLEVGILARWCYGSDSIRLIHYTGKLMCELIDYNL